MDPGDKPKGAWNGEYYVSFKYRDWSEAVRFGFVSGGGGAFYSKTLALLAPGDRIWVNMPGTGYVGVGLVTEPRVPAQEFMVPGDGGQLVTLPTLSPKIARIVAKAVDEESGEYVVRVKWLRTVTEKEAFKEAGLFGNQNTVARPKTQKWVHTVERLKQFFNIDK